MKPNDLASFKMPTRHLLILSAVMALSACANFSGIPEPHKMKQLPLDAGSSLQKQASALWPENNWPQQIGGTALQQLVDAAIADNPNLQVAAARIKAAQAQVEINSAGDKPGFGAAINSTYQRFSEHGMVPPPYGGTFESDNLATLNVSYELDFWGKHAAEMRSALSQEQVALAEQRSAQLLLSSALAHTWLQLARQYGQLELSQQQLKNREKLAQLIQQRVTAGLDNESDTQQSVMQLATIKIEVNQWQEAIALSRNQLAALLGQPPERGLSIPRPELGSIPRQDVPNNLAADLLGRRPDIVAARWRVEANQGDIDVAKNLFYPNINLVGFVGLSSLGLDHFIDAGSGVVGAGPAIRLPIFVGGRLRGQLKGKIATYDAAVATYNQSLTDALRDVADPVQSLAALDQFEIHQTAAEQAAETSVRLAQQRERIGTANAIPILVAESNLIAQKKNSLDAKIRRTDLSVNLIKALGGGYQATLPNALNQPEIPSTSGVTQ